MNISTRQLQAFVYAAQLGSFTKAADRLHMTQAGLSFCIRELETQLDSRLFERTTRSISLTEAGTRFLPTAERTVADLHAAAVDVNEIETRARQTIRLGATPLVANRLIPRAYAKLLRSHPDVKLRVLELQRDAIEDLVGNGELDIGFGMFLRTATGIERTKLFSSPLFLVSAAEGRKRVNPLRNIGRVRWAELRDTSLISLQPNNPVQHLIDHHLRVHAGHNLEHAPVNHFETQIAFSEIGAGSAIIPSFALPACRHYQVAVHALIDPEIHVDFFRIVRKGSVRSQSIDEFCRMMVKTLNELV